jgi:hypothetical protein
MNSIPTGSNGLIKKRYKAIYISQCCGDHTFMLNDRCEG